LITKKQLEKHDLSDVRYWFLHDLFYACQVIFPDVAIEPHLEMCNFLENMGNPISAAKYKEHRESVTLKQPNKLLVGSRGILKSSIKQVHLVRLGLMNPNLRILDLLMTLENAKGDLSMIANILDHPVLRREFADIIPDEKERKSLPWSQERLCLKRPNKVPEPTYTAAGVGKRLTSRHFNIIAVDDGVAATIHDMTSEEIRPNPKDIDRMIGMHRVQFSGLLDEKPAHRGDPNWLYPSQILSLNNRWCDDDYVDYIERFEPSFDEMVIPIRWPDDHPDKKKRNKPSWPTGPYGTEQALGELESKVTTYIWNTQYLCNPHNPAEQIFKKEWLQFFDKFPGKPLNTVAIMDPALSLDKTACFTAVIVVSQDELGNWYIREAIREHADTDRQLDLVFSLCESYQDQAMSLFAIEDVLFQAKILDLTQKDPRYRRLKELGIALVGEHPYKNEIKEQRIEAMQPRFRNSSIFIRRGLNELVNELIRYRRKTASIRDLIDALSYIPRLLFDPLGRRAKPTIQAGDSFKDGIRYEDIEAEIMGAGGLDIFSEQSPELDTDGRLSYAQEGELVAANW